MGCSSRAFDQWGVCGFADVLPLLDVRAKSRVPDDTRSVIVILFGYYVGDYPERNISRYAIVDDYHMVVLQKLSELAETLKGLYSEHQFIPFVDSSPVAEVRAAYLAGLGEVGMNGLLLNPVYGSRCFIGEILTTLPLAPATPLRAGVCTRCGRCVAACPTGALITAGFDAEKCRSRITQKKGALTAWEREQVRAGGFVWGCDCCTDACPVNQGARHSAVVEFYRDIQPTLGYDNAGALCGTKAYGWRGENVLRRNLDILSGKDML